MDTKTKRELIRKRKERLQGSGKPGGCETCLLGHEALPGFECCWLLGKDASDIIFRFNVMEGRFEYISPSATTITGYTPEEFYADPQLALRPSDPHEMQKLVALLAGESVPNEPLLVRWRRKDGTELWSETVITPVRDESGACTALVGIVRDITERKRVEEKLERTRDEFRTIADLSGDIIVRADVQGCWTYLNDGACEFWGASREDLLGRPFWPAVYAEDRAHTEIAIGQMRQQGFLRGFVNRQLTPRGPRTVEWHAAPLYDEQGTYIGLQATGRDVTEQTLADEELHRLNSELEGYAQTVSHDLRTPLANILLAADAVEQIIEQCDPPVDAPVDRMLATIRGNVEKATSLIADLLALGEAGRPPEVPIDVDVTQVVESILEEHAPDIREAGMQVRLQRPLGHLMSNSTQIYLLFHNLITNAIKYAARGDAPFLEISCENCNCSGLHAYRVRDNGPGIPEELLGKLFEPFAKGEQSGTGIGLAIVAKVVKLHGGEIHASNLDGAVFEFRLRDLPNPGG
jgi:PAS domain S-box-containing protein